jgi:hypothetical protein
MRKEILLAVFIGITLGLMITFGIYQNSERARVGQNNLTDQLINNPSGTQSAVVETSQLVINSPEEDFFSEAEEIIVSGSSSVNSFLVVLVNDREYIGNTDESGNFSIKVTLDEGGNLIEVNSLDEDGNSVQKNRSVIYEAKK